MTTHDGATAHDYVGRQSVRSISPPKTKVSVGRALAEKPSGCVVWIGFDKDTLQLGPFKWVHEPGPLLRPVSVWN
jgi:hypothetical protein